MMLPLLFVLGLAQPLPRVEDPRPVLRPIDVFALEHASDPRIAPDGSSVVYVRNFMDVMTDRRRSNLWIARCDGSDHRPLTTGDTNHASPRWSPDGTRLAYVSSEDGSAQVFVRWMDTGQTAQVSHLEHAPSGLTWSPDGRWLAFVMDVEARREPLAELPPKPAGAEWAEPPRVITRLNYRADGAGYLPDAYRQLFVLPADGGTPRQLTRGAFDVDSDPSWTADGRALVVASNRRADAELTPLDTEVFSVSVADGALTALTSRDGPDREPVASPRGRRVAYLGFDDRVQGYQVRELYVVDEEGSARSITPDLDRSVRAPAWAPDGEAVFFLYDDLGDTKLARATLDGTVTLAARGVGGESLGRPYAAGAFSVASDGSLAFTTTSPDRPADVAVLRAGRRSAARLTRLNEDLLAQRRLGRVEELRYPSSHDRREIQAWIVYPPDYAEGERYPLVLEIHGGPFANYGERFTTECQLYAAAGYVVLYVNPRGSTSYGEEFGNLIHHAYPGHDYDDLMSGVDVLVARGVADEERLYVTGGSGGGVLSSWIVGKTGRFRAAVVAKPVINWTSFVLTADMYAFFWKYWFPGYPWEHPQHYFERSPLSLVGNVTTPTMLLTGEVDYRTPISESEQYYQALKLRGIDTALVRVPGASHGIARRPSQLVAKVLHVLAWFERYGGPAADGEDEAEETGS